MSKKGEKRPRVTCPSCGASVAYSALERHRGSNKCVERYGRRKLTEQMVLPEGHRLLYSVPRDVMAPLVKRAGVLPEESPLQPTISWPTSDSSPSMRWVAPTWVAVAADTLVTLNWRVINSKWEVEKHTRNSVFADPEESTRMIRYAKIVLNAAEAGFNDMASDVVALLAADMSDEDQLALSVELSFVESSHKQVAEVVKRAAARLPAGEA